MFSTAFVLVASMVVGQTDASMPEDIRQHIDRHIIGQWTSQTKWGEKEAQAESRSRWTRGQTCVLSESIGKDFDGNRVSSTAILGWDAKQKCLIEFASSSKGENWIIRWTDLTAKEWTGHGSGLYEGVEWSSAAKIQWAEDGARYEDTTGGKPFVIVMKRKEGHAAQENEPKAEDYIAMQQNYFCGEWTIKVLEGEGAGSTGTWSCKLDACGQSFHQTGTMDGKPFFQSIGGYDPHLRGLKEVAFYTDGSTATLLYRHPLKAIQGDLVGQVLRGIMENVTPDGKRETLDVVVHPVDRDKSVFTIHKKGDPSSIIVKAVFERVNE